MRSHAILVANAASPHLANWQRLLDEAGVSWEVWNSHPVGPAHTRALALGRTFLLGRLRRRRLARSFSVSVHAHGAGRPGTLASLFVTSNARVIVHGSEVMHAQALGSTQRMLMRLVLRRAEVVVTTSQATWPHVRRLAPRTKRLISVHPGPNWHLIERGQERRASPSGPPRLLSIRRLLPLYNIKELLGAVATLGGDLEVTLLRGDVPEGEPYAHEISAMVNEMANARIIEHFLSLPDLMDELAGADIVVSLASTDQLSSTILQALGAGCILVASDVPAYAPLAGLPNLVTVPIPVTEAGVLEALQRARTLVAEDVNTTVVARRRLGNLTRATFASQQGAIHDLL